MDNQHGVYDSMGVRQFIKGCEKSLLGITDMKSPDYRYGGFQFSLAVERDKKRKLELRVDIACLRDLEDSHRLFEYTKWFEDWEVFSPNNGSGINIPPLSVPDLDNLKKYIRYNRSENGSIGLVKVFYDLQQPFLLDTINNETKKRAFKVLVKAPLKYWILKNFPDRVFNQ